MTEAVGQQSDEANALLDAIDAHSPLTVEQRANLHAQLMLRDPMDYPSLQRFLIGPSNDRIDPSLTEDMITRAVKGKLSDILLESIAT